MNVITLYQPYASLVMAGIKTWETRGLPPNGDMRPEGVRGLPGRRVNAGDRIGIHAAKRWAPGWVRWYNPDHNDTDADKVNMLDSLGVDFFEGEGQWYLDRQSLPLGALLGTVEVVSALPVVFYDDGPPAGWGESWPIIDTATDNGVRRLTLWRRGDIEGYEQDITDQLPYGNWLPGRWAWELTDPEWCDQPIPAVGKQGVWEWTP